jgi:hypothetical protein
MRIEIRIDPFRKGYVVHLPDGTWMSQTSRLGRQYGSIGDFQIKPEAPIAHIDNYSAEILLMYPRDGLIYNIRINGELVFRGSAKNTKLITGRRFPNVWHYFIQQEKSNPEIDYEDEGDMK